MDPPASRVPGTSMISSRELLLLFTIVGSFFIGVFGASADMGQILPEMGDIQRVEDFDYPKNETLKISGDESTGTPYYNSDSQVDSVAEEAINSPIPRSPANSFTRLTLVRHQSVTLNGAPGETVTLKLGHFVLSGNSTFTLQGTATTTFIIKVKNQFSLTGNAKVVLMGGVQWDDVIFVVRGKGDVVSLSRHARLEGILMAKKRKVRLRNHSIVRGQVIARAIALRGASQIVQPPIVSP
jgi:Ice-binding-like